MHMLFLKRCWLFWDRTQNMLILGRRCSPPPLKSSLSRHLIRTIMYFSGMKDVLWLSAHTSNSRIFFFFAVGMKCLQGGWVDFYAFFCKFEGVSAHNSSQSTPPWTCYWSGWYWCTSVHISGVPHRTPQLVFKLSTQRPMIQQSDH